MTDYGKCPDCGGQLDLHGRTMRWCEACRQIIGAWDLAPRIPEPAPKEG